MTARTTTALLRTPCSVLLLLLLLGVTATGAAQNERWFQVEVSIFSNEDPSARAAEQWRVGQTQLQWPPRMRRLQQLSDLLLTDAMIPGNEEVSAPPNQSQPLLSPALRAQRQRETAINATGPVPRTTANGFRFPDLERDPWLLLPASASDFGQTNRALQRSANHRLLFHAVWRQPVRDAEQAIPVYVKGGLAFGRQHELQGALGIRYNDNRDRIVVDARLWLAEFGNTGNETDIWRLPQVPEEMRGPTERVNQAINAAPDLPVARVFAMQQSREMRSGEFHYLDHPALGLVILVRPWQPPEIPLP